MNKNQLLEWQERLQEEKTERTLLERTLLKVDDSINSNNIELDNLLKARTIAQLVAKKTQQKIEYRISVLVTMALSSIFKDNYEFNLKFVERRNKTEVDFILSKNKQDTDDIINSSGGGVVDIISFALRCAVWSLKKNTRNVFILDEPFKFLSRDLQRKASFMIKTISEKLNLQFIIVSHIPEIMECSDKIFELESKTPEEIDELEDPPVLLKKRKIKRSIEIEN